MRKSPIGCALLALGLLAAPVGAQPAPGTLMHAVTESQVRIQKPTDLESGWRQMRPYLERWNAHRIEDEPGCLVADIPFQGRPGPQVALVWDLSNGKIGNQLEIGLRALDALQRRFTLPGHLVLVVCSDWARLQPAARQAVLSSSSILMPIPSEQLATHECCLPYPIASNRLEALQVRMLSNPQKLDPRVSLGYSLLGFQSLGFDEADDCEMRLERFQDDSAFLSLKSHSDATREHFIKELKQWTTDNAPRGCPVAVETVGNQTAAPTLPDTPDITLIRQARQTFRDATDDVTLTREPPFEATVDLTSALGSTSHLNPIQLYVSSQLDSASAAWAEGKCLQLMLGVVRAPH